MAATRANLSESPGSLEGNPGAGGADSPRSRSGHWTPGRSLCSRFRIDACRGSALRHAFVNLDLVRLARGVHQHPSVANAIQHSKSLPQLLQIVQNRRSLRNGRTTGTVPSVKNQRQSHPGQVPFRVPGTSRRHVWCRHRRLGHKCHRRRRCIETVQSRRSPNELGSGSAATRKPRL